MPEGRNGKAVDKSTLEKNETGFCQSDKHRYGVVQNGLLTFLGSLYKEVAKLLPEFWCIASRDKPPEKNISSFKKHCVLDLECRILSQEPSDRCILYCNVIFHGK